MPRFAIRVADHEFSVELAGQPESGQLEVRLDEQNVVVRLPPAGEPLEAPGWLVIDNRPCELELDPELHWIATGSERRRLDVRDLETVVVRAIKGNGRVKAPIPGQITRLFVARGETVEADQPLCVLEAMKMENEVRAPQAGIVSELPIEVGHIVRRGQLLAEISSRI